jgi:hypothetical protein
MHSLAIFVAAAAINAALCPAWADGRIRLAQSSTVTNCMMNCNAQAANCQTACVIPSAAPTTTASTTSNASASTACILNCGSTQVTCQTNCARLSPSQ